MYTIDTATGVLMARAVNLPKPSPSTRMTGGGIGRIVGFGDSAMFATLIGAFEATRDGSPVVKGARQGYVLQFDGNEWNITPGAGLPNELFFGFTAITAPGTHIEHGLMLSTDDAIYLSRNDGVTWQRAALGLPRRAHCGDLRFVNHFLGGPTIYLGTFGRSIWSASL